MTVQTVNCTTANIAKFSQTIFQLFLAGFLGELINRGSADRNKYSIDKRL